MIVVLHDNIPPDASPDALDTLKMVKEVSAALVDLGYEIRIVACDDVEKTVASLPKVGVDLVFNLVEQPNGCTSAAVEVPAILEKHGFRYTGGNFPNLVVTGDKVATKKILQKAGIPTANWYDSEGLLSFVPGTAVILKPAQMEASEGIDADSVVSPRSQEELARLLEKRSEQFGCAFFAEDFIDGREFNLAALKMEGQLEILPPAEMLFVDFGDRKKVVDYRAKWEDDSFESLHTIRSFEFPQEDEELLAELQGIVEKCWHIFDLRGYIRVDFRVDAGKKPYVLEINVNPCIALDSGFMAAFKQKGFNHKDLVQQIVEEAMR